METSKERVDILICGAGASGGVAAKHFAEAGYSVVVLEQGEWVDRADLPGDKPEFALLASKKWSPDPNVRGKKEDYPIDNSTSDVPLWMYGGVGDLVFCTRHVGVECCPQTLEFALSMGLPMTGPSPTKI
jgi:choline dehydrogenase-like flavoprotein